MEYILNNKEEKMKKSTLLTTSAIVIGLLTGTAYADTIRFWTTEHQPPRLAKQQQMADDFSKLTGPVSYTHLTLPTTPYV